MNKIEFSKLKNKEDMILAFNQLKDDYRQLFAINEDLKEENEFLKLDNPEMNIEHFRIIKENKRKIDNLRKENERLKDEIYSANQVVNELLDIKSRKEKAIEYLANCDWNCKDFEKLYDILGGDE